MKNRLTVLWFCLGLAWQAEAAHTQVRLVLAAESARPGDTIWAAVHLRMDDKWHTYWRNPGITGIATSIAWKLPDGITAGGIRWPTPEKLPDGDLTTYIYRVEVALLIPLR